MWKYEKVLRMYEEVWGSVRKLEKEGWRKSEKERLHVVEGGLARIRPLFCCVLRLDH